MAGKFTGPSTGLAITTTRNVWSPKLSRAYAEGRARGKIGSGSNPHTSGSPAYTVWQSGYDNAATGTAAVKVECCE